MSHCSVSSISIYRVHTGEQPNRDILVNENGNENGWLLVQNN